jgi:hypothetical protein
MSFNVGRELQKFVFGELNGDAALGALVTGIFDFVPQSQAYPFVHIGNFPLNKTTTMGTSASTRIYRGTLQIHIWNRPGTIGKASTWDLINEVRRILDGNTNWTPSEYCILSFAESLSTVLVEPDSVTYHGIVEFNIVLGGRE